MVTLYAGSKPTAATFNSAFSQPIARGRRATDSTASATEVGVQRLDAVPVKSGGLYLVMTNAIGLDSTVGNDESFAQIRYTTDGSAATTSSTQLPGSRVHLRQVDAGVEEHRTIIAFYAPSSDVNLSLLLTVGRIAGTGNCRLVANLAAIDMVVALLGVDPGDTGVDI